MQLKLTEITLGVLCAASLETASAVTLTVNAAGSSSTRRAITEAVIEEMCLLPTTANTTVYRNGANVTRIVCPAVNLIGAPGDVLDFSYDNTTGSYLAWGPVSGNGTLTARVNIATCGAAVTEVIAGKTVNARAGCSNEALKVRPSIGNSDVEAELFSGHNIGALPPVNVAEIAEVGCSFGLTYGVVVSAPLYRALQSDQGYLPGSLTDEANAPSLSRSQIISLATANGGPLNTNWTALFTGAVPTGAFAPVQWMRRVDGSGAQISFKGYFLNSACCSSGLFPAAVQDSTPTYLVTESGSTGDLLGLVQSTTAFKAGFASRENMVAISGNWGFVKLDGVYPSKANSLSGRYTWTSEQSWSLRESATAVQQAVFDLLRNRTAQPTTINGYGVGARDGTFALPFVADAADPFYSVHTARRSTFCSTCQPGFVVW